VDAEEDVEVRGLTSTIIGAVVLVALVGYIYKYEWDKPATSAEEKAKAFTGLETDKIEEVQIKGTSGEPVHLRKAASGWELVAPEKAEADSSEISSITSNLSSLEVQRVVDENPGDLAQYGLNPPRVDVAFRAKDDKDFRHLLLGEKTPTGGDLYAKLQNDKKVFLISSFLESTFNRSPFDLRDKSILEFDRDKVESLEIVNGPNTIQFTRSGTDWKIAKPFAARGDYGTIEGLVTRLSSGQMQRIVDAEGKNLKQYGLDKPSLAAAVTAGSARASLLLGRTEAQSTYAKDVARPMVFAVEESLATDLKKAIGEFRRKDIFDFRSFNANRIDVRRGADTLAFEKTKDKDGKDVWRNAAGQNADTTKVEDLLTKFSNLRAQSFATAAPPSLKSPALTVTVRFDEKNTETVTFATSGADVYASRGDEPGAAKLEKTPYEDALKALDAVK
jgi:hypothetical protein